MVVFAAVSVDPESPWLLVALGWALHIACFLLVLFHCLRNRREANSALLWIFVAWAFPVLGPLLYLYLGVDRVPQKGFRKQVKDQRLLAERRAREDEALPLAYWRAVHEASTAEPCGGPARDFNRALNSLLPDHPVLGGNEIRALVSGDEAFPRMIDAIRHARHHIHLQSFIIHPGRVGQQFLDLLADKARAGVQVRILYDRFGSSPALWRGVFRRYAEIPNLKLVGWTQANPLKRQFQVNLRNHRKILIVDGRKAFCGGINISDDNVTRGHHLPIRDYHFELRGAVVQELQYTFMRDWYFMTDENPEELLQSVYFPQFPAAGQSLIRVVNSGPTPTERGVISDVFFMAMVFARREILLVTPYFVPPRDILSALRSAALRGVQVRLIVPKESNHRFAGLAGRALYEELLTAGGRVFERPPPFMHAKALIVDDTLAIVGTSNQDVRSLRLNYETDLLVFDDVFVNQLKRIVLDEEARSDEIALDNWRQRAMERRMLENFCYLMMPVL